jgi:hypothetical protein
MAGELVEVVVELSGVPDADGLAQLGEGGGLVVGLPQRLEDGNAGPVRQGGEGVGGVERVGELLAVTGLGHAGGSAGAHKRLPPVAKVACSWAVVLQGY